MALQKMDLKILYKKYIQYFIKKFKKMKISPKNTMKLQGPKLSSQKHNVHRL